MFKLFILTLKVLRSGLNTGEIIGGGLSPAVGWHKLILIQLTHYNVLTVFMSHPGQRTA